MCSKALILHRRYSQIPCFFHGTTLPLGWQKDLKAYAWQQPAAWHRHRLAMRRALRSSCRASPRRRKDGRTITLDLAGNLEQRVPSGNLMGFYSDSMGFYSDSMDFIVIQRDINGIYPLVNIQKAIENGHRNSDHPTMIGIWSTRWLLF